MHYSVQFSQRKRNISASHPSCPSQGCEELRWGWRLLHWTQLCFSPLINNWKLDAFFNENSVHSCASQLNQESENGSNPPRRPSGPWTWRWNTKHLDLVHTGNLQTFVSVMASRVKEAERRVVVIWSEPLQREARFALLPSGKKRRCCFRWTRFGLESEMDFLPRHSWIY